MKVCSYLVNTPLRFRSFNSLLYFSQPHPVPAQVEQHLLPPWLQVPRLLTLFRKPPENPHHLLRWVPLKRRIIHPQAQPQLHCSPPFRLQITGGPQAGRVPVRAAPPDLGQAHQPRLHNLPPFLGTAPPAAFRTASRNFSTGNDGLRRSRAVMIFSLTKATPWVISGSFMR